MWDGERFVSLSVDRKRELEIPLSQPLKVGWLMKEGLKVKSWRKRWFVLVPGFLFYFRKEDDAKPRGGLFLEDCAIAVKQRAGEASGSDDDSGDPPPPDYPWEFFVRGGRREAVTAPFSAGFHIRNSGSHRTFCPFCFSTLDLSAFPRPLSLCLFVFVHSIVLYPLNAFSLLV